MVKQRPPPKKNSRLGVRPNVIQTKISRVAIRREMVRYISRKHDTMWVVGHGTQLTIPKRVPQNTAIIFVQRPGLLTSSAMTKDPLFQSLWSFNSTMDKFIQGTLPASQIPPFTGFKTWERRIYLPGEFFPEMFIALHEDKEYELDRFCGVKRVGAVSRRYHRHTDGSGVNTTLSKIIQNRPGVYFVIACRGTVYQYWKNLMNVYKRTDGSPSGLPPMNTLGGAVEGLQKREERAARKIIVRRVARKPARIVKRY